MRGPSLIFDAKKQREQRAQRERGRGKIFWQSAGKGGGWQTQTIRDVELRSGDEIAVQVHGPPGWLDYVQVNAK